MKLSDKIILAKEEKKELIKQRLNEFGKKRDSDELFNELCYCLLTANFNAERTIKIQESIGKGFLKLSEQELALKLKELGHRFPNKRAEFIIKARAKKETLKESLKQENPRDWLVNNIKGLGMKESSHFLRNIGFNDFAIIDFHIIDLLEREGVIIKPKSLTKKNYLIIENELKKISSNLAELDLVLWYIETGKILK